ncbi:MAG: HD domain-containing phosphohydrolase [Actinomycetota bacterium]
MTLERKIDCVFDNRETERSLQILLDSFPYYALIVDEDHRIVLANKTTLKGLKKTVEDIRGTYCPKIIHGLDDVFPGCPLEEAAQADKPVERDLQDNKTGRWMRSVIYPMKQRTVGDRRVFFHTAQDITVYQEAEEGRRENSRLLELAFDDMIAALAATVRTRDPYSAEHQVRVTKLATAMAVELGFSEYQVKGVEMAAAVHDIGRLYVPTDVLNKTGPYLPIEREIMQTHCQYGYDILKGIHFKQHVPETVLQHHERLDGSGYPNSLSGDQIFKEARIISVADVAEAMQSHRPYRPCFSRELALAEITDNKGRLYDPEAVDACVFLFSEGGFEF